MNHIIPMRNERSTCSLYRPAWFSRITAPNQRKNSVNRSSRPSPSTQEPADAPFSVAAAPAIRMKSAIEPKNGSRLPCGM